MILQQPRPAWHQAIRCQHTRTHRRAACSDMCSRRSCVEREASYSAVTHSRGAPVVMLATGVTAATRVLAVLAHATMARAHVPPLLAVGLEACSSKHMAAAARRWANGGRRAACLDTGQDGAGCRPLHGPRCIPAVHSPWQGRDVLHAMRLPPPSSSKAGRRCPCPPARQLPMLVGLEVSPRLPSTTPLLPVPPMSCSAAAAAAALTGRHLDLSS